MTPYRRPFLARAAPCRAGFPLRCAYLPRAPVWAKTRRARFPHKRPARPNRPCHEGLRRARAWVWPARTTATPFGSFRGVSVYGGAKGMCFAPLNFKPKPKLSAQLLSGAVARRYGPLQPFLSPYLVWGGWPNLSSPRAPRPASLAMRRFFL